MKSSNYLRLLLFVFVALAHVMIFILPFHIKTASRAIYANKRVQNTQTEYIDVSNNRVMRLVDIGELAPFLPPESGGGGGGGSGDGKGGGIPPVETIAETMIETDKAPAQKVVPAGTLSASIAMEGDDAGDGGGYGDGDGSGYYLPQYRLTIPPKFNVKEISAALVYPPIAQRSGIEGNVILELSIDITGAVRGVSIVKETPSGSGFGDAAVKAFTGLRGAPAQLDGEPVPCLFRYPVRFIIN
ncbi:MAG: energy transducer TonB [Treponema sp.]|nr:energy transducer TonB [Treponema sp.]